VIGSLVFAIDAAAGTVSSYSARGETQVIYQSPERPYVTEQIYSELLPVIRSGYLSTAPPDTVDAALRRALTIRTALPAWTGVIGDPSGRLWLRTYRCTMDPTEDAYGIIDTQGNVLGRISIPIAWTVLAVRGERVLVVRRGDLGVEYVELYHIER
jgi:hypothetical protein